MPKWLVRLQGERFDLEDLPSLVCSPEHTVIEEDGSYYLKSSDFDSLGSADEVRDRALTIVKMLNGAMKLHIPGFRGVSEAGVTLIEEDGRRHHYVYLEGSITLRSKVSANATVTGSNGTPRVEPHPPAASNPALVSPRLTRLLLTHFIFLEKTPGAVSTR